MDAGANASVLPAISVASLVGFGAAIAGLPAFAAVRDWIFTVDFSLNFAGDQCAGGADGLGIRWPDDRAGRAPARTT